MAERSHTRDHWQWRNGWRPGRRSYWWFVDLTGEPALIACAQRCLRALALDALDPAPHLHISVQQVGFFDLVSERQVARLLERTRHEPPGGPLGLTFGPVDPNPESVVLRVTPWEQLHEYRLRLRRLTAPFVQVLPGADDHFWPHVSIGYTNAQVPTAPFLRALAALQEPLPVPITVREVSLVLLNRENRLWSWETLGSVALDGENARQGL
ncbi:2'-5' RNA ligase family protein [Streptomyces sp. NPDC055722]